MTLPETVEAAERFAFAVRNGAKEKGYAWVWLERVDPKKARVPRPEVLAIRVGNAGEKQALLESDSEKFFTEPERADELVLDGAFDQES